MVRPSRVARGACYHGASPNPRASPATRKGGAVARGRGSVGPVRLTRTFAHGPCRIVAGRREGQSIQVPEPVARGLLHVLRGGVA